MYPPCRPYHVLGEPLPDGLALYSLGFQTAFPDEPLLEEWLMARINRLEVPAVYLDMSPFKYLNSGTLGVLLRLCKGVVSRGGRFTLCNTSPGLLEVFQITKLDKLPWLAPFAGGMPGPGRPATDPAWLTWNGGVVAAMAR